MEKLKLEAKEGSKVQTTTMNISLEHVQSTGSKDLFNSIIDLFKKKTYISLPTCKINLILQVKVEYP